MVLILIKSLPKMITNSNSITKTASLIVVMTVVVDSLLTIASLGRVLGAV